MRCTACGAENPDASNFCQRCGFSLTGSGMAQSVVVPAKTAGTAIAALVLGILTIFTCGITMIPALICGIIALVQIGGSNGRLKGTAMAIIGIVMPIVAIPIIALLMGILMPAIGPSRTLAQRIVCGHNLSAIGKSMLVYAYDNDGEFPTPGKWCDLLIEQADATEKQFTCPAAEQKDTGSYAMNPAVEKMGINSPADMVLIFESQPGWNQVGGPELLTIDNHQGEGVNILFVDGHVEFIAPEDVPDLLWSTYE